MLKRWNPVIMLSIILLTILAACGSPNEEAKPTVTRMPAANAPGTAMAQVAGTAQASPAPVAETGEASPAPMASSPQAETVAVATGDIELGKQLSAQCMACHSVDGRIIVGPTWQGLYGHDVELDDGTIVKADDPYITESIREPMAKVVKGFPPAMPPYPQMTDEQIADIIAYIKSLE